MIYYHILNKKNKILCVKIKGFDKSNKYIELFGNNECRINKSNANVRE